MGTRFLTIVVTVLAALVAAGGAQATTSCTFTTAGTTMTLDANCTTDATIFVPNGYTLDGAGYTITALDPTGGHFVGAVVANGGSTAYVTNLIVTASGLANVCDALANRLRWIMFDGASGSITGNTVIDINQGASGCQEGNAIEVRNEPFDGSHVATQAVEVGYNVVLDYQKTGIVANGDVDVWIHHNVVGASATQADLAANSIQLGFGAQGVVEHNQIAGNQWLGLSDWSATAVLLYEADAPTVRQNNIRGNADIGIYVLADEATVDNNRVLDEGVDGLHGDIGIFNDGVENAIENNKVRGYDTPYDGVVGGNNKAIPGGPID